MDQSVKIYDKQSIEGAINIAIQEAKKIGFNNLDCNLIASAVSEIATNILKYANSGGLMKINIFDNLKGIRFEFTDTGPGIENIDDAMTDGFSVDSTSLGVGLGAAKRAMDFFNIESGKSGTTVIMNKWLPISKLKIDYGVASLPDINYSFNGDGYVLKEYGGDCILAGIIDGLGEGEKAWKTTQIVKEVIYGNYMYPLDIIIKSCESAIKNKIPDSGAAIGLIRIEPDKIYYSGLGDTFANIYSEESINLNSQQGIVGTFEMPKIKTVIKENNNNCTIILCTDGIKNYFTHETIPLQHHAQDIAEHIIINFRRAYGDATVLVIKLFNNND